MKFSRLGIIAAFAMALCGQALAAAPPAAPKIDPKQREQGMKEVPAIIQAAGVDCTVSDAYFMGNGDAKVAGKAVKTSLYEAACGPSLGYIVIATPGADPQTFDCLTMKEDYDKKVAAKQKGGAQCVLPGNADPKQGLIPKLAKAGVTCTEVTAARWMGSSPKDKVSLFEVACPSGGYIITDPLKGSEKPLSAISCMKSATMGVECALTSKEQIQQNIIKLSEATGKPACKPTKARWVVTDPSTATDYYEVGCADGSTGYMFTTDSKGGFKSVIECVRATRIADGCTLSSADAGQTAEVGTYTKLAKQIGYDCDVNKYQSYGAENGGQREVVELSCANHPDGAFALVPTGSGQTGESFNCVRAMTHGLACRLTPAEATYAKIASEIAARGKTTCKVNGGRGIGRDPAKGTDFIEVTCADGPSLVLEYSKLPQETLISALPCAQAPIADACKLKK
jgi:hypothetical protein